MTKIGKNGTGGEKFEGKCENWQKWDFDGKERKFAKTVTVGKTNYRKL